jgi:hypothetical protein
VRRVRADRLILINLDERSDDMYGMDLSTLTACASILAGIGGLAIGAVATFLTIKHKNREMVMAADDVIAQAIDKLQRAHEAREARERPPPPPGHGNGIYVIGSNITIVQNVSSSEVNPAALSPEQARLRANKSSRSA